MPLSDYAEELFRAWAPVGVPFYWRPVPGGGIVFGLGGVGLSSYTYESYIPAGGTCTVTLRGRYHAQIYVSGSVLLCPQCDQLLTDALFPGGICDGCFLGDD